MSPRDPKIFEEIREKSKEKIIFAAFELFSSLGYWRTSISKIAAKAGISKGLMYNYFESKEHLLRAVVDRMLTIIQGVLTIDDEEATPREKMTQLIENIFNHLESNKSMIRMMTKIGLQIGQFEYANKIMVRQYNEILNKLESNLLDLNFKQPKKEAIVLAATIDGAIIQCLMFGDDYPVTDIKESLLFKYTQVK